MSPALPKPKRERNEGRLNFVRQMPCLITAVITDAPFDVTFDHLQICTSPRADIRHPETQQSSEAHHVRKGADSGTGTKPSDFRTVPLCQKAHEEYHRIGHDGFCEKYDLDLEVQLERINREFEAIADTLAPLLHWRVCHVWAWLTAHAPDIGFPTIQVATAYGADSENNDVHARTGCIGCPLASKDNALRTVIAQPGWEYLQPLTRLKPLYEDLSFNHANRLRKVDAESKADGSIVKNPNRIGPLTMDARRRGLTKVLAVQTEINNAARLIRRPAIDLINDEEYARILELIEANTWPNRWTGDEPIANELIDKLFADGTVQPLLGDMLS